MEAQFFPGASRRVILSSVTLQKDRKIKLVGVRMPLTGENMQAMPDWMGEAYTAVSQSFTSIEPEIQTISDLSITFSNHAPGTKPDTELFESPSVKAPNAEIRGLTVLRTGSSEDPDVTLQFSLFAPFSRDLWKWLGEMGGNEVHMQFPSSKPATEAVPPQKSFVAERPELDPKYDEQFAVPTLSEAIGPDYEEQVRKSMGAEAAKPRMVSSRPPREKPKTSAPVH